MTTKAKTIEGRTVLVTGANRGIGKALVDEALSRGAKRVYAGEEDIFPDPMSQSIAESWRNGGAKALERENAAVLADLPVAA
jgi:NAD(P)-dependent dehydrogenase (short-subunit alcohol dehydrogenase family)